MHCVRYMKLLAWLCLVCPSAHILLTPLPVYASWHMPSCKPSARGEKCGKGGSTIVALLHLPVQTDKTAVHPLHIHPFFLPCNCQAVQRHASNDLDLWTSSMANITASRHLCLAGCHTRIGTTPTALHALHAFDDQHDQSVMDSHFLCCGCFGMRLTLILGMTHQR